MWTSDPKIYSKISVLFNNHIKDKITRTVLFLVKLRNMKINAMKLLFQVIFSKTLREYFNRCPGVMETGCLQHWPTSLWLLRTVHILGSQWHTRNPMKRASWEGVCVCLCVFMGWGEEDAAGERTVFQSLEHRNIDHAYYFQVWQDPKTRKFLLKGTVTCSAIGRMNQQIKESVFS